MKKLTFLVFLIPSALSAQQLDKEKLKGMKPRAIDQQVCADA